MAEKIEQLQLEQWLWGAANILRGPVDASDFKAYIFPLLFLKRISDVFDEERAAALAESVFRFVHRRSACNPSSPFRFRPLTDTKQPLPFRPAFRSPPPLRWDATEHAAWRATVRRNPVVRHRTRACGARAQISARFVSSRCQQACPAFHPVPGASVFLDRVHFAKG